jgi:hypothetical protein
MFLKQGYQFLFHVVTPVPLISSSTADALSSL